MATRGWCKQELQFALRFNDKLAFHTAVTESTTVATVEGVRSCGAWNELHHCRGSLLEFETIFIRTENQPGFAVGVGPIGVKIDLEAMSLIDGGELQHYWRAHFHADRRWRILILLGGDFEDQRVLIRLRAIRWTGES